MHGDDGHMNPDRRAIAALTAAGLLWGTTVPLSKLALEWLSPSWLTFARFAAAAAILFAAARPVVRAACAPAVLVSGAIGYGGSVVVQNAGIARTSVSHAALLIGAAPVLVAITAALWHRTVARARLLRGRDPIAVTAVQFVAAAIAVLPLAVTEQGMPAAPHGPGALLATAGLAVGGTLLPFALFAYGQSRVSAEVAGAFLNLEPLVGAVAGALVFGDPAGAQQVIGGAAILAGIALSSFPLLGADRRERRQGVTLQSLDPDITKPHGLLRQPRLRLVRLKPLPRWSRRARAIRCQGSAVSAATSPAARRARPGAGCGRAAWRPRSPPGCLWPAGPAPMAGTRSAQARTCPPSTPTCGPLRCICSAQKRSG